MEIYSRREFFQIITLRAASRAHQRIAKSARALQPLPSCGQGRAQCARCYASFDPATDELLCPACCENDAKQQALLTSAFAPKQSRGVDDASP